LSQQLQPDDSIIVEGVAAVDINRTSGARAAAPALATADDTAASRSSFQSSSSIAAHHIVQLLLSLHESTSTAPDGKFLCADGIAQFLLRCLSRIDWMEISTASRLLSASSSLSLLLSPGCAVISASHALLQVALHDMFHLNRLTTLIHPPSFPSIYYL
jgi:hypothetical protein